MFSFKKYVCCGFSLPLELHCCLSMQCEVHLFLTLRGELLSRQSEAKSGNLWDLGGLSLTVALVTVMVWGGSLYHQAFLILEVKGSLCIPSCPQTCGSPVSVSKEIESMTCTTLPLLAYSF